MKTLKRLTILILLVSVAFGMIACGGVGADGGAAAKGPIAKAEAIMAEEMSAGVPDFTSPPVEDNDLKVSGMPEEVVWITSYPKDLSSKDTKKGGTLHLSLDEYPTTFRYVGPESNLSTTYLMNPHAAFLEVNPETQEFMPYAATHWAFGADNQTVYYKLNEHMKWSDGVPCTADDFVFAWESLCSRDLDDPWCNNYYDKFKVKKINDYCVSVKYLESSKLPKVSLISKANFSPRPKHFYNGEVKNGWYNEYNWKIEPTTGPYVVNADKCVQGDMLVVEKVKNWWAHEYSNWKNRCNIDTVEYKVITGGQDIIEKYFWNGELDLFDMNIPATWRRCAANENITKGYVDRWVANYLPLKGIQGIFFNTKFPLFSNKKVRQAMYYAIDIQGMIDQALYGEFKRSHNIGLGNVWGGIDFNDHSIRKPDFNPDTARKMLGEAGYTVVGSDGILQNSKGERVSFELLYSRPSLTERLSILKEQAKKAGVEIELKMMESGAFNTVLNKKHQAWWGGLSTDYEPSYWELFSKANAEMVDTTNFFGWWSEEMEKLLAFEESGPPLEEKAENNKKIERLVHEEALIVPNYYTDFVRCGAWKWIRMPSWGNRRLDIDADFMYYWGYMWIDEDIRQEVLKAKAEGKTFEPRVWTPSARYIAE